MIRFILHSQKYACSRQRCRQEFRLSHNHLRDVTNLTTSAQVHILVEVI